MAELSRRTFLLVIAAVPLARHRKPPLRKGFGAGGFGLTPFGS
jgi:hypothetical protein